MIQTVSVPLSFSLENVKLLRRLVFEDQFRVYVIIVHLPEVVFYPQSQHTFLLQLFEVHFLQVLDLDQLRQHLAESSHLLNCQLLRVRQQIHPQDQPLCQLIRRRLPYSRTVRWRR